MRYRFHIFLVPPSVVGLTEVGHDLSILVRGVNGLHNLATSVLRKPLKEIREVRSIGVEQTLNPNEVFLSIRSGLRG
jgi:hypothetical protein